MGPSQALLPLPTFSEIERLPSTAAVPWQQLLRGVMSQDARLILNNLSLILKQR